MFFALGFQEIVDLNAVNVTMEHNTVAKAETWTTKIQFILNKHNNEGVHDADWTYSWSDGQGLGTENRGGCNFDNIRYGYWTADNRQPLKGGYRFLGQGAIIISFIKGKKTATPYRNAAYVRLVTDEQQ